MKRVRWVVLAAVVAAVLSLGASSVHALQACDACGLSRGASVAACGQCALQLLFELLGGW